MKHNLCSRRVTKIHLTKTKQIEEEENTIKHYKYLFPPF